MVELQIANSMQNFVRVNAQIKVAPTEANMEGADLRLGKVP